MERTKLELKRTLYIGLGGTGVSVLLKIKKCFIDCYGEIPPMIGFLAIDTETSAFYKEVTTNLGKSIKLEKSELLVCSVKDAFDIFRTNHTIFDWVPTKNVAYIKYLGARSCAGQVRSNGRFIAFANLDTIQSNISAAITKIHQQMPSTTKYTVDVDGNDIEHATTINVFSSIAGGTGSGMLIDILCLINKAMKEMSLLYNLYPWIVLPDIFEAMCPIMPNVKSNSYGTIRELDYMEHLDPNDLAIDFG